MDFESWSEHVKGCYYTCDKCDFKDKRLHRYDGHMRFHTKMERKNRVEHDGDYTHRITVFYK